MGHSALRNRRERAGCAVAGLWLALLAAPAGAAPREVELYFELEARVETAALDATVRAAVRLLMEGEPASGGGERLRLVAPLAPAWKLYAVDPAGPLGEEAKLGAVVTLAEPSWEALAVARDEVDRLGLEQYRRWVGGAAPRQPFDGSFAFVVIGPPRGRFLVEVAPSGRLTRAVDQLTDRWLPGGFDELAKAWRQAAAEHREPPRGYWFWNRGEPRPFAWEPHTYHALVAALELLALPLFPGDDAERAAALGAGGSYALALPRVTETARRVLEILAPKVRGKLAGAGGGSARFTVATVGASEIAVDGGFDEALSSAGSKGARLRVARRAHFDRRARLALRDEVEVRLVSPSAELEIRVGYRPPLASLTPAGPSALRLDAR